MNVQPSATATLPRPQIKAWRFFEGERYLGRLTAAGPSETSDQALKRFLRICPAHKGRDITVDGGR